METGQISDELARSLTPEQKKELQKQIDAGVNQRKKNSALNDAYNGGMTALEAQSHPGRRKGRDTKAIESFNKAGELDPNQLAVWSHLAEAYMGLGRHQDRRRSRCCRGEGARSLQQSSHLEARRRIDSQQLRLGAGEGRQVPGCPRRIGESRAARTGECVQVLLQRGRLVNQCRPGGSGHRDLQERDRGRCRTAPMPITRWA